MAADKSILFLLLIDALKNTNREHPKTTKDLIQDVHITPGVLIAEQGDIVAVFGLLDLCYPQFHVCRGQ